MRFLCLPGAYGNIENFKVQLGPFCEEMSTDPDISFFFTQGQVPSTPPPGFEDYFGAPPHYRFVDLDRPDWMHQMRSFGEDDSPEELLRALVPAGDTYTLESLRKALDYLYTVIDKEGPFDGICGYSEGATIGASLIMDEQARAARENRPSRFKAAIFFAGWPPMMPDTDELVLTEDSDKCIECPTCHIIGANDPYIAGSMALFNACNPENVQLFDHGKGHTIPRGGRTLKELGDVVRRLIREAEEES